MKDVGNNDGEVDGNRDVEGDRNSDDDGDGDSSDVDVASTDADGEQASVEILFNNVISKDSIQNTN